MTRKDGKPRSLPTDCYYAKGICPFHGVTHAFEVHDDPWAGDRDVAKFDAHNRWKEQS